MADIAVRFREVTVKEQIEKGEWVEFHAEEFPGYFVQTLAPKFGVTKHMVNIAYLEPGAKKVHHHPAENVLYILEGEGIYFEDYDKWVPVKAGDLCVAAGGEPHGFQNTGTKRMYYLAVEGPLEPRTGERPRG